MRRQSAGMPADSAPTQKPALRDLMASIGYLLLQWRQENSLAGDDSGPGEGKYGRGQEALRPPAGGLRRYSVARPVGLHEDVAQRNLRGIWSA